MLHIILLSIFHIYLEIRTFPNIFWRNKLSLKGWHLSFEILLLLLIVCVPQAKGDWLFNQYLDTSTWKYCYALFPGCHTCDINAWSSCVEGLYFVQDQKVWVESWANVIIPSTSVDQSKYFADNYARTWEKWGSDCSNWIDDFGWTNVLKDSSSSDSTSYSKSITNSKLQSTLWSSTYSSCKLWTSSAWTFCSGKLLSSGACSTAWTDTHCRYWNADKAVCTLWADGYVLSSGSWVAKTWTVANWNDWTSSGATTWTTCKEGYLNGGTTCTTWVSNCLQWSSSTTCDLWKPGYILYYLTFISLNNKLIKFFLSQYFIYLF